MHTNPTSGKGGQKPSQQRQTPPPQSPQGKDPNGPRHDDSSRRENPVKKQAGNPAATAVDPSSEEAMDRETSEGGRPGRAEEDDEGDEDAASGASGRWKRRSGKSSRSYGPMAQRKVGRAMREMKAGTLRSGRSGKKVTSQRQAVAIGLAEARRAGGKVPNRSRAGGGR